MKLKRVLLKSSGEVSRNGHIYSNQVLEDLSKQINSKLILGELSDGPIHHSCINIKNVVCKVTDAVYDNGNLYTDVDILPTSMSNHIPNRENGEYDLDEYSFDIRAYTNSYGNGNVIDNLTLISVDLIRKHKDISLDDDIIPFC